MSVEGREEMVLNGRVRGEACKFNQRDNRNRKHMGEAKMKVSLQREGVHIARCVLLSSPSLVYFFSLVVDGDGVGHVHHSLS